MSKLTLIAHDGVRLDSSCKPKPGESYADFRYRVDKTTHERCGIGLVKTVGDLRRALATADSEMEIENFYEQCGCLYVNSRYVDDSGQMKVAIAHTSNFVPPS